MIISHSRQFIFVKTVKVAGTSLELALSRFCDDEDVLTPHNTDDPRERMEATGRGAQNHLVPLSDHSPRQMLRSLLMGRRRQRYREHMPAHEIRAQVGADVWNRYFTFTVVRHPYDYIVSRYFWDVDFWNRSEAEYNWDPDDFDQFLRYRPERLNENWRLLTDCDEVIVDFVVRFERLREDLAEVSRRIGLPHNIHDDMSTLKAKAGVRPRRARPAEMLTGKHRTVIDLLCEKEIEAFYAEPDTTTAPGRAESPSGSLVPG